MFGIGFTELLIISIVAILFLGPDKLPQAMIEMAKFIKSVKKTVGEAKSSLEEEMKISDLKERFVKLLNICDIFLSVDSPTAPVAFGSSYLADLLPPG